MISFNTLLQGWERALFRLGAGGREDREAMQNGKWWKSAEGWVGAKWTGAELSGESDPDRWSSICEILRD